MTPSRDAILAAARDRLSERTLAHSVRVAETSVDLARRFKLDETHAWVAGMLHDWDKGESDEVLIQKCARLGVDVTFADHRSPHLLHARTGAREVAHVFPDVPHEVVLAIETHTLGGLDMSPLQSIVYCADLIEPGRVFAGADDLRELAREGSLDNLFIACYAETLSFLVDARREIHPITTDVWNHVVSSRMGATHEGQGAHV